MAHPTLTALREYESVTRINATSTETLKWCDVLSALIDIAVSAKQLSDNHGMDYSCKTCVGESISHVDILMSSFEKLEETCSVIRRH